MPNSFVSSTPAVLRPGSPLFDLTRDVQGYFATSLAVPRRGRRETIARPSAPSSTTIVPAVGSYATASMSESRQLPLVVVSDHEGLILHPNLPDDLAKDLCGVAIVVATDSRASWEVTRTHGREWSCYNGAIRIYWPLAGKMDAPQRHPLWTAERLLHRVPDTGAAADRIREQIRRRVFGLSTFTHSEVPLSESIRTEVREQRLNELRRDAEQGGDLQDLVEEYDKENSKLVRQVGELRTENADLRRSSRISRKPGNGRLQIQRTLRLKSRFRRKPLLKLWAGAPAPWRASHLWFGPGFGRSGTGE